ncbi:MAG TPA: hypothetical protein VL443_29995 [Cyclobacteriaceae bacterium]|jgi:hypothetical protein|nr:hypothetical protein [Cyclobacteriaceae bacterium]
MIYSICFTSGQTVIATSEEEARILTGNKTYVKISAISFFDKTVLYLPRLVEKAMSL